MISHSPKSPKTMLFLKITHFSSSSIDKVISSSISSSVASISSAARFNRSSELLAKPTSFFLFAGAGSGKTRSLVQALKHIAAKYRDTLRLRARQVAVITYTNAACDEITRRVEYDPLFVVSTIHSFAWSQIKSFNSDIREWLRKNLQTEIAELMAEEAKGRAGTKASASRQASIDSKSRRLARLDEIKTFTYNPNSDNRERNALNHSEVVKIFAAFLLEKSLMQRMAAHPERRP